MKKAFLFTPNDSSGLQDFYLGCVAGNEAFGGLSGVYPDRSKNLVLGTPGSVQWPEVPPKTGYVDPHIIKGIV